MLDIAYIGFTLLEVSFKFVNLIMFDLTSLKKAAILSGLVLENQKF